MFSVVLDLPSVLLHFFIEVNEIMINLLIIVKVVLDSKVLSAVISAYAPQARSSESAKINFGTE